VLAAAFLAWGIPTAQSITLVQSAAPDLPIIASGGLRTGLEIAKCIALGACLGGMASPFLKAAVISPEKTIQTIKNIKRELQVAMFAVGASNLDQLAHTELIKK
jgi:isopentenyl-diphosphate delta-isomerase